MCVLYNVVFFCAGQSLKVIHESIVNSSSDAELDPDTDPDAELIAIPEPIDAEQNARDIAFIQSEYEVIVQSTVCVELVPTQAPDVREQTASQKKSAEIFHEFVRMDPTALPIEITAPFSDANSPSTRAFCSILVAMLRKLSKHLDDYGHEFLVQSNGMYGLGNLYSSKKF